MRDDPAILQVFQQQQQQHCDNLYYPQTVPYYNIHMLEY